MKINNILAGCALVLAMSPVYATEINYSYADLSGQLAAFGSPKADSYDVAIKITNFGHENTEVAGIRVLFPESDDITGLSAWISTELKLVDNKNVPDLVSVEAFVENEYLMASFPEGFTIPEEGLFVGYSFTVEKHNEETQWPIILGNGDNPNGLYLHTAKKYYSWLNYYENIGKVSAMEVTLRGDFAENDGEIAFASPLNFGANEAEFEIPLTFTNYGGKPIGSMEFEYSYNGNPANSTVVNFDPAMEIPFTGTTPLSIFVENKADNGSNLFSLTLTKINDQTVANPGASIETTLNAFAELPKKRVLVEEFTGLWCGYCPRGWAALEYMSENYPDDFVAISYHSRDDMETVPYYDYPVSVSSYPVSCIDRKTSGDPFFGSGFSGFGFLDEWKEAGNAFTPATIEITGVSYDPETKVVNAETATSFITDMDDECRVFYILVADGLEDPSWLQVNYLTGESFSDYGIPQIEQFLDGEIYIEGLVFNDVPVVYSDPKGVEGSLPAAGEIKAGESYAGSYQFLTDGAVSTRGVDLIGMAKGIRVIAGVANAVTGEVLNCTVANVDGITGISHIMDSESSSEIYTVSGIKVTGNELAPGTYIRRVNGKSEKFVVR